MQCQLPPGGVAGGDGGTVVLKALGERALVDRAGIGFAQGRCARAHAAVEPELGRSQGEPFASKASAQSEVHPEGRAVPRRYTGGMEVVAGHHELDAHG